MISYNTIIELDNSIYKYMIIGPTIKDSKFAFTLFEQELLANLELKKENINDWMQKLNEIGNFVSAIVEELDGAIKLLSYITIPTFDEKTFELIPIAKGFNTRATFIFSNNKEYLESILKTNTKYKVNNRIKDI